MLAQEATPIAKTIKSVDLAVYTDGIGSHG